MSPSGTGPRSGQSRDAPRDHQRWRLVEVTQGVQIANRNSGLFLQADTNARTVLKPYGAGDDRRRRRWQLLPV